MDAFYASVEQMDNPKIKGKPVVVGGSEKRGVVAAASYEARKFGIKSAMSSVLAKKMCKDLIFVRPRFDRYKSISLQIKNIFRDYTDTIEPLSLDEAFLDVTVNKRDIELASDVALEIRNRIFTEIGLTASAGISINKFLAKVATEINKPNGQKTIHPSEVEDFIDSLPIEKFHGIGKVTARRMNDLNIYKGADLKKVDKNILDLNFGKSGLYFYNIARGIHDSPVNPNRARKSVGAERTFSNNINSQVYMLEKLASIASELEKRMTNSSNKGRTITIKIKYEDFSQETRSKTIDNYVWTKKDLIPIINDLLIQKDLRKSVRLLGISISNLYVENKQASNEFSKQLEFSFI